MSIDAIVAARKVVGINPRDKFVLMALADYANDDMEAWPKQETLAEWTCFTRETINRALKALEESGFISSRQRYRDDGGFRTKKYKLHLRTMRAYTTPPVTKDHTPCDRESHPPVIESHSKNPQLGTPNRENLSSTDVDAPDEETTSSAREASNLPSSLKKGTGSGAALMNELLEIWNQHRGRLPSLRSLSDKRAQLLTRLIKDAEAAKLDPRAVVKAAALEVVNDSHYIQGRYTLENIIQSKSNRLGKLIDKMLEEADPSSSVTFKPGQRVRWLKHRMVPQRGYDYGGVIGEGTNGRTIVAVEDGSPELPHIQIRTDFLELVEDE